jgi:LPS-assembly lipoprotein
VVQVSTIEQAPTASLLTMTAFYTLAESANGRVIATGRRQVASAYDVPEQRFAALRSERDAENRAARELAEQLHMAIAQDLSRGG